MRERIAQLAAQFLQRCAREVAASRDLATRLRGGDAGAFKEWQHLAHRIRGTGGSLGFESLSTCAAAIERLAEARAGSTTPDPEVTERLMEHVGRLEAEINRLVQPTVN
jgi:chemotaxis protein histidine kinase CheA